tara:strand:+ start:409 stop:1173 length:765 start_codon:yes stop_codon:yes gene_type:complete
MIDKKVIWITGASTGIGKATALKFASKGWTVAVSARSKDLLDKMSEMNSNIYSFPLDVTNEDDCKKTSEKIIEKFGNIDLCIFSTGIHDPDSEKEFNSKTIRKIMEVNFFGTMNAISSIYNFFKNEKKGHICIVSSVAGYRGLPAAGAYCSSKAALTSFSESLYFDLHRYNVKVSLVSPGFIKTPMTDKNSFYMPMLKTAEYAAEKIYNGLINKNSFEIHFPKLFTYLMKLIQFLPNSVYFGIQKLANKLIIKR